MQEYYDMTVNKLIFLACDLTATKQARMVVCYFKAVLTALAISTFLAFKGSQYRYALRSLSTERKKQSTDKLRLFRTALCRVFPHIPEDTK